MQENTWHREEGPHNASFTINFVDFLAGSSAVTWVYQIPHDLSANFIDIVFSKTNNIRLSKMFYSMIGHYLIKSNHGLSWPAWPSGRKTCFLLITWLFYKSFVAIWILQTQLIRKAEHNICCCVSCASPVLVSCQSCIGFLPVLYWFLASLVLVSSFIRVYYV